MTMVISEDIRNDMHKRAYVIADKMVDSILDKLSATLVDGADLQQQEAIVKQMVDSIIKTAESNMSAALKGV